MAKFAHNIKTEEDYITKIYSNERLDAKMRSLEYLTIPSLRSQSYKHFVWNVYTSPELPEPYMKKLQALLSKDGRFKLKIVDSMQNARDEFATSLVGKYISVRLDDDDALHPQYFKLLAKSYRPGQVLNPRHGLKGVLSNTDTLTVSYHKRSWAASGLAYAQGNIVSLGDHTKINQRVGKENIITFPYKELYIWSLDKNNITKSSFTPEDKKQTRSLKRYLSQKYLLTPV